MILGAVLAGGASRRFGSDKALALVDGRSLIDHVIAALAPQCDALVVVGRSYADWPNIDDRPASGAGPLAALNAALDHAAGHGYAKVLTAPCDMPDLPEDLAALLGQGPAVLNDQPVVGLWPAALATRLDAWLATGNRSVHGWVKEIGAAQVELRMPVANINTPADLANWRAAQPSPSGTSTSPSDGSSLSTQPG
jgi:molybdenum cofactor guanylyltransferase